ncbi:SPC25-domain-containing protein [Aaosphaeria arxii CBS 175.79]|uniref:Signal peptidase complex subunit 2 n=1 Tax=Aaosphaeria arxii CBS 175.79 TaxID=1450172 RepID=A0A6A5XA41_9PLEO|nr:SPC25-domain-containing protein [Aaosphaeria arxii CBS 175.79]KAF2009848.1 SPC25-domain-containing protein [Aaosphaeria arxii CBS 175.79]
MSNASTKIAVYSLPDLKNTTDDALPNYLHSLKFRQIHTQTDVRLALGYVAVIIAGVLFYFDWTLGWDATKPYTAPAVAAYFILNGAFTYWLWFVEKGAVYEGEGKTGKILIRSSTKKHTPIYECDVTFTPSPTSSSPSKTIHIRAPFTRWFTSDGYFVAKPFQQWLASEVPVVGAADPNNVVEEIGRGSETERTFNVSGNNAIDILEQLKAGAKVQGGGERRRKV